MSQENRARRCAQRQQWSHLNADDDLIEAIAAGDGDAFAIAYDRFSGHVHNLCRRILRDDAEAEDTVIDVFEEVWRRPERFDPQRGTLLTYLLVVARSRALDRRRSDTAAARLTTSLNHEMAPATADDGPAHHPDDPQNAVVAAFHRLDPKCREAVRLCIVEGLTSQQAARVLAEPVGTIKSRIRNSLIRMRDLIRTSGGTSTR